MLSNKYYKKRVHLLNFEERFNRKSFVFPEFPKPEKPTSTIFVEEGKTVDLKCDIPHKNTDLLRWYQVVMI